MQREAKTFTTNLQSSMVSFTTHDDREYLVAPCVALVPGVLNGDLVTMDAIAGTWKAWNRKPVVLNHPADGEGNSVSAAESPSIIANIGIGDTWHADIEDNKLRVQVWLDLAKAKKLGGDAQRVVDRVKNGDPVEVSTGYWAYLDQQSGVHNGVEYTAVTKQIIPDHLAILPNAIGACNWDDGCGIPRMNQEAKMDEKTMMAKIRAMFRLDPHLRQQMTVTDKIAALSTLIQAEMDEEGVDPWRWHVIDIEDNFVIMGIDNAVRRRPFIDTEGGNVALSGEWEDVFQQTTFAPVTNEHRCAACQGVTAHAEEGSDGQPEPEQPNSEEPPERPDPVPEEQPEPDKEGEGDPDNPDDEENDVEITAQQAEILAYVEEQGLSLDQIRTFAATEKAIREEYGSVVKTYTGLDDTALASIPTATLKALAATYAVRPIQGQAATQQDLTVYAGRGLANPNASGVIETGPPRPQVLVKKAV